MKIPSLIILFFFIILIQTPFEIINKIKVKADFIAIDYFDNLYLYQDYNLFKYDKNGKRLNTFSLISNGVLTHFDASDPYMLLLYYKDLNQIVFLDDRLAQIGSPINLDEYQLYQVRSVCKSKNFAVWIYDDFDRRLINYGFNPAGILSEIKLKPLNLSSEINYMQESGNHLYANTGKELLIFDIYGNFIQKIPLKISGSFQVINNKIIYSQDNRIFLYSLLNKQTDTLSVDLKQVPENILLGNERMFVRTKNAVSVFKINEP